MADLEKVLAWVNNTRFYEFSLPPVESLPNGRPCSTNDCPIVKCFPAGYFTDGSILYRPDATMQDVKYGRGIEFPEEVREFIAEFDAYQIDLRDPTA